MSAVTEALFRPARLSVRARLRAEISEAHRMATEAHDSHGRVAAVDEQVTQAAQAMADAVGRLTSGRA